MAMMMQTGVQVPRTVADAIVAHAREGKPEEICGIVRGRGLVAFAAIRGQNLAADRVNNYDVDPQTLLQQFKFEEAGDEMMGIYHSHPISVAYPSATDAWNAHYPDCIYFICSLEEDAQPITRAFRMITHFLDLDPSVLQQDLPVYETRPGLFAYYVEDKEALPTVLTPFVAPLAPPFYLVYTASDEEAADLRAVALFEYPLEIQD